MAKGEFKVEIPINMKGGESSGTSSKGGDSTAELKKLNKGIIKLDKTMFMNIDVIEILSSLAGDLYKVLQPLFKILSLLFMVVFLPLMPLVMLLVKGLAMLVKLFTGGYGNIAAMLGKAILALIIGIAAIMFAGPILAIVAIVAILALLWEPLKKFGLFLWEVIKVIGGAIANVAVWIWDKTIEAFGFLGTIGTWIWDTITGGFAVLGDFALKIWEFIKTLFTGTIDAVSNIWDFIKSLFKGTINVAKDLLGWFKGLFGGGSSSGGSNKETKSSSWWNPFDDFIQRPGQNATKFSPQDTVIGVKDTSKIGGSNTTININNPSVRNDRDIKKIADEVSRALQRQTKGRFS